MAKVCKELFAERGEAYMGTHVHVAYGLSKDWGVSGMRAGVLLSHNKELIAGASNLSCFMAASSLLQVAYWQKRTCFTGAKVQILTSRAAAVGVDQHTAR